MNDDDAADRLTKANRVSIRAVLVPHGQDVAAALAKAGIYDPISIPFVFADESFNSGAILSDGRTPNLVATLELDKSNQFDVAQANLEPDVPPPRDDGRLRGAEASGTTTLPAAYGFKSLAPIRKRKPNPTLQVDNPPQNLNPSSSAEPVPLQRMLILSGMSR